MRTTKMEPEWITILRSGNRIVLDPTTPRVQALLEPRLSYEEKKFFHGPEAQIRKKKHLPPFEFITWECFGEDHRGRLATSYGFINLIRRVLKKNDYKVKTVWASQVEAEREAERLETVYKPRWDRIEAFVAEGFKFRPTQRPALEMIGSHDNGRIECPPAWGKGTLILLACMLFPKAKVGVVTKNIAVLHQRLYPELAANLPSVGIVGGGRKVKDRRVMCYSADSLHHATGEEDILFIDEGHQACADNFAERLARFEHSRIFMFSATWGKRLDNKDLRAEAIAGPVRFRVSFKEAEQHKMIVPVEVIMSDVIMDVNPCGEDSGHFKKRSGYWANDYRNELIASDARLYGDDVQVLITVESVEHGLYLQKLLPEYALVYNGASLKYRQIKYFKRRHLIDDDWRMITDEEREQYTRRFTKGKLKKAICTSVWNIGVNFKQLQVVIRADGGGSPINDTQIPGRGIRIDEVTNKQIAILHDYLDQFDTGCHGKATRREHSYITNEWKVHRPKKNKKSLLRELMKWSDE